MVRILLTGLLAVGSVSAQAAARPDPEAHFDRVMANGHLQVAGQVTGEQFCWHAAHAADDFVDAYLAWGDMAWLEQGGRYFDWLVGLMATGPDGYRGWIGPYIYDNQYWCDVHVGDAILVNPMLRFAEVVLQDPKLIQAFGDQARAYVDLARHDLMEKWDQRGTWHLDGRQGAYRAWDRYLEPGDLSAWRALPQAKSGLSLPFNKQMDMGVAALRLYRITGEEQYRQRAEEIFRLFQSRLRLFEDGYLWNYWEPLGPWDIDQAEGRIRHWVNVHPSRNYQAREVGFVVEAYHTGVVFTQADIERIIQTNLGAMWNGDMEAPRWRNAGLGGPWAPQEEGRAGTLWSSLADFDERARQLIARTLQSGTIDHAYFHRGAQQSPGWQRRYVEAAWVEVGAPLEPTRHLTMAAVLPRASRVGEEVLIVCKAAVEDTLRISLRDGSGALLETLHEGRIEGGDDGLAGIFWMAWNGGGQSPGSYIVRWQLGDEYRQYKIIRY
ncbi:MAG: hypothetical protein GKR89_20425 [Candidatus Latescibacteria bacterium]|nr:hypothetical protein [Candidatus Latescibacterota bacterium]